MRHNIELHIEELILHGFSLSDRYRIAGAVEKELARLFVEQEVPSSLGRGGEFDRLDVGKIEVHSNTRPEKVGSRIAQAVYKGFRK